MGADATRMESGSRLRSPIHWAVLDLVLEHDTPSYGYELIERYERRYGRAMSLGSNSQIYASLSRLAELSLIREVTRSGEQRSDRRTYVGTPEGRSRYREYVLGHVHGEHLSVHAGLQQLVGLLAREPESAPDVLKRYREMCLRESSRVSIPREGDAVPELEARLLAEASRLEIGARLQWAELAAQHFRASR